MLERVANELKHMETIDIIQKVDEPKTGVLGWW